MRSKQKVLILLGVVAVAAVVSYRFIRSTHQTDPTAIRVSGNIEVTDVDVSFKIPGRLEERAVSEGETVTAGQLVARLDRSELMEEVAVRRRRSRHRPSRVGRTGGGLPSGRNPRGRSCRP